MSSIKYSEVIQHLLSRLPEITEFYDQQLPRLYAKGLPHVIYGSIFTEYVDGLLEDILQRTPTSAASENTLKQAFNVVEDLAESDDIEVQNIVECSILEGLWRAGVGLNRFTRYFGLKTRLLARSLEDRSN